MLRGLCSGDELPVSLIGAEAEEWQTADSELRYIIKEEHGDLIVQPELRNWVGSWHTTSTAASFLNDEVRMLPSTQSITGAQPSWLMAACYMEKSAANGRAVLQGRCFVCGPGWSSEESVRRKVRSSGPVLSGKSWC